MTTDLTTDPTTEKSRNSFLMITFAIFSIIFFLMLLMIIVLHIKKHPPKKLESVINKFNKQIGEKENKGIENEENKSEGTAVEEVHPMWDKLNRENIVNTIERINMIKKWTSKDVSKDMSEHEPKQEEKSMRSLVFYNTNKSENLIK